MTNIHAQSIFVVDKSGTKIEYPLISLQTITFSGSNLYINNKDNSTASALLSDIKYLTFSPVTELIDQQAIEGKFHVYPNPVIDRLNLVFKAETSPQSAKVSIFTVDGMAVYSNQLLPIMTNNIQINTSSWSRGIYIIRLTTGNKIISSKVIKN